MNQLDLASKAAVIGLMKSCGKKRADNGTCVN